MSSRRAGPISGLSACPCSGLTLDKFVRPAIMTVLAGGELHGYRIAERVAASPVLRGVRPDPTGVYRTLRAMEKRGFVSASWSLSERGPARRVYRLTAAGRGCLRRWAATLAGYHQAVGGLLATIRSAAKGGRGA